MAATVFSSSPQRFNDTDRTGHNVFGVEPPSPTLPSEPGDGELSPSFDASFASVMCVHPSD
jgi:hypothetical protein